MLKRFFPDDYVESAYRIDYEDWYRKGIRGILFDIDNTLVGHGADASQKAKDLMIKLKEMGFRTCLISNNNKERVNRFNKEIQTNFIYKAGKPGKSGYLAAMKVMGTDLEHTLFVGDQLFTDIYGAKRIGMKNVLVKPVGKKEEIQIVIKRWFERIVLHYYRKERGLK